MATSPPSRSTTALIQRGVGGVPAGDHWLNVEDRLVSAELSARCSLVRATLVDSAPLRSTPDSVLAEWQIPTAAL